MAYEVVAAIICIPLTTVKLYLEFEPLQNVVQFENIYRVATLNIFENERNLELKFSFLECHITFEKETNYLTKNKIWSPPLAWTSSLCAHK